MIFKKLKNWLFYRTGDMNIFMIPMLKMKLIAVPGFLVFIGRKLYLLCKRNLTMYAGRK